MPVGLLRSPRRAFAIYAFAAVAFAIVACSDSTGTGSSLADDRLIAFVSDSSPYCCGHGGIFVMHADGTHMTRVTSGDHHDETPAWSPDGSTIVFKSDRSPGGIWAVNADGTNLRSLITATDFNDPSEPAWSPNGQSIAFSAWVTDSLDNFIDIIEIANADGSHPHRLITNTINMDAPSWSPDGSRILFTAGIGTPHIYVAMTDGTQEQQLSHEIDFEPEWSPDGRRIVTATLDTNNIGSLGKITVMGADGSNRRTFTTNGTSRQPSWSPDGRQIAYEGFEKDSTTGHVLTPRQIYRMNPDGSDRRAITPIAYNSWAPAWKPAP
jgi:Tol biopolymer transport system component